MCLQYRLKLIFIYLEVAVTTKKNLSAGSQQRPSESSDNFTPRDVYLGQGEKIKNIREIIKQNSINKRISENKRMKLQHK